MKRHVIVQILNVAGLETHVEAQFVAFHELVEEVERARFLRSQRDTPDDCGLLDRLAYVARTQLACEVIEYRDPVFSNLCNAAARLAAQAVMKTAEQAIERLWTRGKYFVV